MTVATASAPDFLDHLPLSRAAWEYARDAHSQQTRLSDGAAFIEHPRQVALLLQTAGAPDPLVAAGLLHDTLEHAETTSSDIALHFGPEVAALVAAVTEQPSIPSYRGRKAELRKRAIGRGEPAALLFAADKIAKVREYREQLAQSMDGGDPPRRRRLHHYTESLLSLEAVIPDDPLVRELRSELAKLTPLPALPGRTPAGGGGRGAGNSPEGVGARADTPAPPQ
jgi:hypothetical protein